MSSFDEYIEIQQQLMDRLNSLVIPLIDSAPSGAIEAAIRLNQMSYSPIQESSGLYSNIFASVQERLDSLTNGYASSLATALQNPAILVADFQNILSPDTADAGNSWRPDRPRPGQCWAVHNHYTP